MREIKFRAIRKTDIGNGRPVYFFTLEQALRGEFTLLLPEHYHISQYTGLKDKNGKEIYKGDIVKIWRTVNKHNPTGEKFDLYAIAFQNGMFSISHVDILEEYWLEKMEVIGNIYQNPELLNT